ncbi:DUF2141 domain-containing protein [Massilia yuzhufengensis]|uniref:Uncharacterized conserved protein, DUF2141 family n=1 Tax=Massilia yuzhufengensis TaxID=1164594 RepID=A0A1I1K5Z6_9BURK|nr:DUF2141 domain-containing protein [Massilia yuzhufengensis]SFC56369.1 Uncharacterized conserved protein, DUF2141 family [Massilia yuzhufengensis]
MRHPITALLACALLFSAALPASAATVEVRVSNVAARGKVSVAVCDRERFLKECTYSASVPAQAGETVVTLKDIPPGNWAVLAFQDANENGKLDRNFIGIPSENYGFSRDAKNRFGPPGFDDAVIEVREGTTVAAIRLH